MSSITTWMRLEPRTRTADMSIGLQARVHDPLWLLARQWQIGEFAGEDNGSPASVRWQGESASFSRFAPGAVADAAQITGQPYDVRAIPLEALVEREPHQAPTTQLERLRSAVESGLHFLRILGRQSTSRSYRDLFIGRFPFAPLTAADRGRLDPASLSFVDVVASRVPDGRRLYSALRAALRPVPPAKPGLPAEWGIEPADAAEIRVAGESWLRWYESLMTTSAASGDAWLPDRMEYGFSVATRLASGERVLTAQEHLGGAADWYDFNVNEGVSLGASNDAAPSTVVRTVMPAPVGYRGMPAARFWQFEDARVDFGAVNAGAEDLARMLLVEFAITYANDWFVIPVDLEVGTLCRTSSLIVTNTFGERFVIRSAGDAQSPLAAWRMFQLSSQSKADGTTAVSDSDLFMLAPTVTHSMESRAMEEVLFLRDEAANMAWAVERVIESATEAPLNRFERPQVRAEQDSAPSQEPSDMLRYRLATEVPDYWVPLVPAQGSTGLRLKRGQVLQADGSRSLVTAKGRILNADLSDAGIFEEEVRREGIRVRRHYQLARWHDGSTHLWVGRRKSVGRGEGSSGLKFDSLDAPRP